MKLMLWATVGIKRAFSREARNARFNWDVPTNRALTVEANGKVRIALSDVYDKTRYDGFVEFELLEFQNLVGQFEEGKLKYLCTEADPQDHPFIKGSA